jgi:photosystem II stability/assembly factor-like uncharacterized protein
VKGIRMSRNFKFVCLLYIGFFVFTKLIFARSDWELVLPPGPTTNQLVSLYFINEITGWSVGEYGTILNTSDAGNTWRLIEIPQSNDLRDIFFPTRSVGFTVGKDGLILKSNDGGETWFQQSNHFTNNLSRVRFRDEKTGWVIGEKGLILFTNNGGNTWTQQISNSRYDLNGLALIGESGVCAVGFDSSLLVTENDGQLWQRKKFNPQKGYSSYNFEDVYFLDSLRGWIVGSKNDDFGLLVATTNGGETWNEYEIYSTEFQSYWQSNRFSMPGIQQILFIDHRNAFCLTDQWGNFGNIPFSSRYSGRTWHTQILGFSENYPFPGRLAYLCDSRIINTGYRGEFRISSDKGDSWQFMNQEKRNFVYLFLGNEGNLRAWRMESNNEYQWIQSLDYGKSWEKFDPQFYDLEGNLQTGVYTPYMGNFIDDDKTILRAVCYDNSLGTFIRNIYESKDFGLNWNLIHPNASPKLALAKFLSSDTLINYNIFRIETSTGKTHFELLFTHSFNCGYTAQTDSFRNIWNYKTNSTPFISKHYFFNGHTGFIIGSEGNIIKTMNTGQSWENIPSGVVEDLWDIAFVNRQTGFVVGNFGRILKTEDSGRTWRKTDSGTQEDIYAIGFRNETEGWAGTETGLRYTRDGGETWQGVPMRYFHGPVREFEFDKKGTGYAFTNKLAANEDFYARPFGYILLMVLKEGGVVIENTPTTSPYQFTLSQNYPNPFNSTTHIRFSLPENASVSLKIYNIQGQLVRTLLDEVRQPGEHSVVWDGATNAGQLVASGVYFYRLTRNGEVRVRKLLLLN